MKETGWAFITSAIILLCIFFIIVVGDYFGEAFALLTLITELIIIGIFLIKFNDKI